MGLKSWFGLVGDETEPSRKYGGVIAAGGFAIAGASYLLIKLLGEAIAPYLPLMTSVGVGAFCSLLLGQYFKEEKRSNGKMGS